MIVSKLEQELYALCCKEWRENPQADPGNIYHRALKEIERLRCNAHWTEGVPADFPNASPRPWGLYHSDSLGLSIVTDDARSMFVLSHGITIPEKRWNDNMELIVRAVNNWKPE